MLRPQHLKELDELVRRVLNSQRYSATAALPDDGPGVYVFTMPTGEVAYVGRNTSERSWAQRAHFHTLPSSKNSTLVRQIMSKDEKSAEEATALIREMSIQGMAVNDANTARELEGYLKRWTKPRYCSD